MEEWAALVAQYQDRHLTLTSDAIIFIHDDEEPPAAQFQFHMAVLPDVDDEEAAPPVNK